MKFRKKPVLIDAFQWWKHGDVQEVTAIPLDQKLSDARRRRLGWLETPEGGHLVFPGDWIIIDSKGRLSTCNPISFTKQYESAEVKILPMFTQGKSM